LKKYFLFFFLVFVVFFSGCSSKKVFEPTLVKGEWQHYGDANESIIDTTSGLALLEDRSVLAVKTRVDVKIQDSYRPIANSDGWIISATMDGNLTLQSIEDKSVHKKFELKKTIAGASAKDDILAVLFSDNEMALYSVTTKELLLKEQGNVPVVVDSRIVNPYFMNELVLFPTLDGKIIIINSQLKKKLRTTIVSSEEHFNNIIYFNVIDEKIIAATGHKILSMSSKEIRIPYEIRNIAYDDKNIFINTKQGEVLSLTPDLQVNAKVKFPFAHFLGMIIHKEKLYLLEKEGYIIECSKDLLEYNIYKVDIDDGYIFVANKIFYINDTYISVE